MDELNRLRTLTEQLEHLERLSAAQTGAEAAIELTTRKFTGTADKGGIVATVDGSGNLLAIDISGLSKRRHDGVTLGDAAVKAVHAAEQAAAQEKAALMGRLGADLDLIAILGDVRADPP